MTPIKLLVNNNNKRNKKEERKKNRERERERERVYVGGDLFHTVEPPKDGKSQ